MGIRALKHFFLFLMGLIWPPHFLYGAACCGSGAGLPNLIIGDHRGQVSFTGSNAAVTHEAREQNYIIQKNNSGQEVYETFTLSGSYQLSPRWQIGASLPFKKNTQRMASHEESSQGLGDPRLAGAFEFLPEFHFSYWKPRGFIFTEINIPTSRSIHETQKPQRTDSLGSGFYSQSLGLAFVKIISTYDFLLMGEYHQGLSRQFHQNGTTINVNPGNGHSVLVGLGLSPFQGNWRMGTTLLYAKDQDMKVRGDIQNSPPDRYYWETGINLSYLIEDYSLTAAYRDQSFLGRAANTTLTKTLALTFIRFFSL